MDIMNEKEYELSLEIIKDKMNLEYALSLSFTEGTDEYSSAVKNYIMATFEYGCYLNAKKIAGKVIIPHKPSRGYLNAMKHAFA